MLLNNRVGLSGWAKLASYSRDDDIFALGIFCFCTVSNFPLQCQERFLSTSAERSQITTALLDLCYHYKKVKLANCLLFYQSQCTAQHAWVISSPSPLCYQNGEHTYNNRLTLASEVVPIKTWKQKCSLLPLWDTKRSYSPERWTESSPLALLRRWGSLVWKDYFIRLEISAQVHLFHENVYKNGFLKENFSALSPPQFLTGKAAWELVPVILYILFIPLFNHNHILRTKAIHSSHQLCPGQLLLIKSDITNPS